MEQGLKGCVISRRSVIGTGASTHLVTAGYSLLLDYRDHHVTCLRTFIYLQYVFPARTSQCCPYH